MAAKQQEQRNIDIWLVLVIVLIVLTMGGGMWLTGKTIDARLDEMMQRTRSQSEQIQTEMFALRKELQDMSVQARKAAGCACDVVNATGAE